MAVSIAVGTVMVTATFYRKEAERCRALALGTSDTEAAQRWNQIATDYENLAEAMAEQAKAAASKMLHVPMQQQPMQQQQAEARRPGEPTIVVRAAPAGGFRWRVIMDGETAASGEAKSEFEAREAANEIVKRIVTKPPEAP